MEKHVVVARAGNQTNDPSATCPTVIPLHHRDNSGTYLVLLCAKLGRSHLLTLFIRRLR